MSDRWLLPRLASYGERPAMVWKGQTVSYATLCSHIDKWRNELKAREVRAGERVAISGDYSPEVCALLIALIENRNIAVPLSRATDVRRDAFLQIASVGPVFVFEHGGLAEFFRRPAEEATPPLLAELIGRGSPGLVVFSSGSAGESKASLLDFDKILSKFEKPRSGRRTIVFLLLDHLGGINTLFHILSSGGVMVLLEERRPEFVCKAIEEHKVELLPTTPTFLKMLLISEAYRRYDLSSLKMISYGTEPMPESTLADIRRALPHVELKQTYGLTELGVLPTKSRDSGSLWVKVGGDGFEVKIVNATLHIRSASAMLGYLNAPSPFDEEGFFNTGDLVDVDGDYLRILGRKSEMINVGGEKVFPAEIESVLLEMDNVEDALVAGKPNPVTGQVVMARLVLRETERREDVLRRVRMYCKGKLAPYKIPVVVEIGDRPLHSDRFKKVRIL